MINTKIVTVAALAGLFSAGLAAPGFAQTKLPNEIPPCTTAARGQPSAVTGSTHSTTCADPNPGNAGNNDANASGTGASSGVAGAAPSTSGHGASGASGAQGGTAN